MGKGFSLGIIGLGEDNWVFEVGEDGWFFFSPHVAWFSQICMGPTVGPISGWDFGNLKILIGPTYP